ncbi:MAG: tRNA (N(6)-L-threonylcarbamoyladenosine(37)-C(2))-methylthiotransferase MtaB [Thermodesulfobacteria bacterium]|nr:tRNA (N(6)-L-threonylcarbamoyladenosine(37)-C(2))-methylthiotransferase MtaB [Thermodesulfobacteriota bacterium]
MRVAIYTLGCKVNQFESWAIAEQFEALGCELVSWKQDADIYLVNTCAVTSKAAYQSRQILNRLRREHPDAKIIATGCHVQTDPSMILESVGGGICLAGNEQKPDIAAMAIKHSGCTGIFIGDICKVEKIAPLFVSRPPRNRTRVFLKVQDGCNAFCSYCIVPYARGRSRSLAPELVAKQVEDLAEAGVREVVITGIHVGLYGRDLEPASTIFALLRDLCERFPQVRFRLSSIEPTEIEDAFIDWAASTDNFCPHFHVPLQSGSDKVLKDMNRRYEARKFMEVLHTIKERIPHCGIGTDVMTGFPTEGPEEFSQTEELLKVAPISYLHAFPYSPRPGTVASAMVCKATRKQAKERARRLIELGQEKRRSFYQGLIGKRLDVLIEGKVRGSSLLRGRSGNYAEVVVESDDQDLSGRIVAVEALSFDDQAIKGRVLTVL